MFEFEEKSSALTLLSYIIFFVNMYSNFKYRKSEKAQYCSKVVGLGDVSQAVGCL